MMQDGDGPYQIAKIIKKKKNRLKIGEKSSPSNSNDDQNDEQNNNANDNHHR